MRIIPRFIAIRGWVSFWGVIWLNKELAEYYEGDNITLKSEAIKTLEHEVVHLEQVEVMGWLKFLKEALFWRFNLNLMQNYRDSFIERDAIRQSEDAQNHFLLNGER